MGGAAKVMGAAWGTVEVGEVGDEVALEDQAI
jgi:hypothetical protein